jgi:hypothetical protein
MSTTDASSLLNIMKVRESMQDDGITHPHPAVRAATRQLVSRLRSIEPEERIEVSCELNPLHARYIRALTGEVLAEILLDEPEAP